MALEGAYAFDDVGASTVLDLSGNGRDINLTGTAGAQVADGGLFDGGGALGKTGATMPVLPASLLAACETDDRGIMFDAAGNLNVWWVRFEKDAIGSGVWGVLNISDSVMEVQARRASDEALATRPSATLPGAANTNYCATYVRSTGVISFYRAGSLVSTSSFAAGTQLSIGADRINIAEWSDTGPAMDNLRFFSHAPDATEVAALAGTPVTAGGDTSLALDPAAEVDTAQPFGREKAQALALTAEVETAQPFGLHKALALGTAIDVAAAQAIGQAKARAIGVAGEVDTAVAFTPPSTMEAATGGLGMEIRAIMAKVTSVVQSLGLFESVNGGQLAHTPGAGLRASVWPGRISSPPGSSGLSSVSLVLPVIVRIYGPVHPQPVDEIDEEILEAVDQLGDAYAGSFTLGGLVRGIDIHGRFGQAMTIEPGYLDIQDGTCRVETLTLPLIINDAWNEVP